MKNQNMHSTRTPNSSTKSKTQIQLILIYFCKHFEPSTKLCLVTTILLSFAFSANRTCAQTLGIYPNTSIVAGKGASINPSVIPTNTINAIAYTNSSFSGVFRVNPSTGIIYVTDAKQAGIYNVTVKAFSSSGSSTTSNFMLTVTNPECSQGLFTAAAAVNTENGAASVAVGDFNNDGKQDLAVNNYFSNSVSIRFGNGKGGFVGSTNIVVGTNPYYSVSVADFNGDGNQDLAIGNENSNSISIKLGNGSGGFTGNANVAAGGMLFSLAIGDFNNDGIKDIAASLPNNNAVAIRLGNGDGTFNSNALNVGVGSLPRRVTIGDFNGDGNQDLATANENSNTISVRLGDGLGSFNSTIPDINVGIQPRSITIGDFNSDGIQDLAVPNAISNDVTILTGIGNGNFLITSTISALTNPEFVAVGDFNGDGKQDVAVTLLGANTLHIHLGNGSGGFLSNSGTYVSPNTYSIAVGDFNNDGIQDLASSNFVLNTVTILLGGANKITVKGNNIAIVNGDVTPAFADHTNFGNVNVNNSFVRTYTIQNKGTTELSINGISISGLDASMFSVGALTPSSPIAAGSSAIFQVTFTPTTYGLKTATVNITNNNCDESLFTFNIKGNFGVPAEALHFDGANDFVNLGSTVGNGLRTIQCWFKLDAVYNTSATDLQTLIARNDNSEFSEFGLYLSNFAGQKGKLVFYNRFNHALYSVVSNDNSWNANQWYQVTGVINSVTGMKLYINGVMQSDTDATAISATSSAPEICALGRWGDMNIRYFKGVLDEVRLWNRALSPCEVQVNMNCELDTGQSGLVAYYKFNQGLAALNNQVPVVIDFLTDVTYNLNNGSLTNFTLNGATSNWVAPGAVTTGTKCTSKIIEEYFPVIIVSGIASPCNNQKVVLSVDSIFKTRFADSVVNFSSQYLSTGWSATQALGNPNVYPNFYGDSENAWASLAADTPREFLELSFANPAPINYVDIYETFNPGSVDTVYVKNPNTGLFEIVYSGTASPQPLTATKNHITFPTTAFNVSEIRIAMNSGAVPDWSEIDAVGIGELNYTFLWSTGNTTDAIDVYLSGSYTVTVTDEIGCSKTLSVKVLQSHLPDIKFNFIQSSNCSINGKLEAFPFNGAGGYTYDWYKCSGGITQGTSKKISAQSCECYYVIVTDRFGCTVSRSFTIPKVTLSKPSNCIIQANLACNVDFGSPSAYKWNNNLNLNTNPLSCIVGGDYQVVISNSTGDSITSCAKTIVVNPLACGPITKGSGKILISATGGCAPYSVVWTANPADGPIVCYNAGTTVCGKIDRLTSGSHFYTAILTDDCGNVCSITSPLLKLSDDELTNVEFSNPAMSISPNPTSGLIKISFSEEILNVKSDLTIYNITGQIIFQKNIDQTESNQMQIDLSNQPKGIFCVSVNVNGQVLNKKLILE